jgi:broad specificity phosphatase PhoE
MKTIYYIRHFEALHNVLPYNYALVDPVLSPLGQSQAAGTIEALKDIPSIDLIVCSPLTRTLQTYLLLTNADEDRRRIPLIIHPDLQEKCSEPCDTGRPIVELKRDFPSLIEQLNVFETTFGDDDWRDKLNPASRYSPSRVDERARTMLRWLLDRPEEHLVVVSHNLMLKTIFQLHGKAVELRNGEVKKMEYPCPSLLNI